MTLNTNKLGLVTGGGMGLGRSTAIALTRAGVDVAITYLIGIALSLIAVVDHVLRVHQLISWGPALRSFHAVRAGPLRMF